MRRIWHIVFLWLALVAPVAAGAEERRVAIAYLPEFSPWLTAVKSGAYERATGYRIDWRPMTSSADVVNALHKGEVAIGAAESNAIAAALSLGHDIQLFWICHDTNFAEALIARNGSRIVEPQDLRGKRIAITFASNAHYHLLFALEQFRIDVDDVLLYYRSPSEIAAAWKAQRIEAAFVGNPVMDEILPSGKILLTSGRLGSWGRPTFSGLIADRKWSHAHPEFMTRFVAALADIYRDYSERQSEWSSNTAKIEAIAEIAGGTAANVMKTFRLNHFPPIGEQLKIEWLGGEYPGIALALHKNALFLKKSYLLKQVPESFAGAATSIWARKAATDPGPPRK